MSLSRLSPRSTRTGITRSSSARQKPEKSSRHLRLWDAIRRTRKEIDLWQRQVERVDSLFNRFIVPREERLTDEYCNVTALLINHFEQAALSEGDQSLLGLWITENLQSLSDHPFAPIHRRHALNAAWKKLINVDGAIENQLARLASDKTDTTRSHDDQIRVTDSAVNTAPSTATHGKQDPEAVFNQQTKDKQTASNGATGKSNQSHHRKNRHNSSPTDNPESEAMDAKINVLEQRLSVERLFRQLAKVLHPDREQNESLKAEKHILMSQCLKARTDKDIDTLLSLYCEHVGELPDDLTDNTHAELLSALQQQLKQLQLELRQLRFGDPLHTQIVERYSALNDADCERRIMSHAESLNIEINNTKLLTSQLGTLPGLEDALVQRREVEMDRVAIDELTGNLP
ncbi:MAG: hypothetical protein AB8B79_17525 [Granulosicoccus sp.]